MIKLGVIFGGKSVEHEISVISAVQAMGYMNEDKYEIIPIYITKNLEWYTGSMLKDIESYRDFHLIKKYAKKVNLINKKGRFVLQSTGFFKKEINEVDLMFPIVHGHGMEDGSVQGYLELVGVPYAGSNIYASVVGQDKVFMKQIFESTGIPTPKYVWFFDTEFTNDKDNVLKRVKKLNFPVIIKPATLGSSIGIIKIDKFEDFENKFLDAINYDTKFIVEEMVDNLTEVNISIMGNYSNMKLSEIEEVLKEDEILSYRDKYIGGSKGNSKGMVTTRRIIPARISDETAKLIKKYALEVFHNLNNSGVARVDFLINSKTHDVYVNEMNTCPGSLAFYLWEPLNISYPELLEEILTTGIKEYKSREKKTSSFDVNILENFGNGLKGIKK